MIFSTQKVLSVLTLPAVVLLPLLWGSAAPAQAQLTDDEILSRMEGSNLPPGYFDPEPIFSLDNLPSLNPYITGARVLMRPNTAGSWLETNPSDPADANSDAMKDSSYPYMPDTWRDTNGDVMPDQSYYDPSFDF